MTFFIQGDSPTHIGPGPSFKGLSKPAIRPHRCAQKVPKFLSTLEEFAKLCHRIRILNSLRLSDEKFLRILFLFLATCSLLAAEMLPSLELSANTIKLIYIVMMGMSMFLQVETLKKHSSHAKAVDEAKVAKTSLQSQVTQLAEKHEHERQNLERDLTDARNQAANHKQNLETALSQKEGQQKQIARLEAEKTRLENSQQSSQEAINLLSLLQQHGRLIDFLSEQDISSIPNEQVGAAALVWFIKVVPKF